MRPPGVERLRIRSEPARVGPALSVLSCMVLWGWPLAALAWGGDGHRIVARTARERLSAKTRAVLVPDLEAFERACVEPDERKTRDPAEGPRHYVDIERWSDDFLALLRRARSKQQLARLYQIGWPVSDEELAARYRSAPRSRAAYERWRGDATVDADLGTIFYAVADTQRELRRAAVAHDDGAIRRAAGDLCHYVGDLVQPLHNTVNYRGQLSGNVICRRGSSSIHERYESEMVHKFRKELERRVRSALAHGAEPAAGAAGSDLAIEKSRGARAKLAAILDADRSLLPDETACAKLPKAHYLSGLYELVGDLTAERLSDASRTLATLLEQAGQP